jgi:hypothetical protein
VSASQLVARIAERLRGAGPVVTAALVVASVVASFGVGYLVTNTLTGSDSSEETQRSTPDTPSSTTTESAAPRSALTVLADACRTLTSGAGAPYLAIAAVSNDNAVDPRTRVPTPRVGILTTQAISPSQGKAPFAIVAVVLPAGDSSPTRGLAVDRAGTVQLWISWDGTALHKGIRTWDGRSWRMADERDPASNALTIALDGNTASFYWAGLRPGTRVGFVTADAAGCSARSLDATGRPSEVVAG